MSIDMLREELRQIIETSDYDKLQSMREAILEKKLFLILIVMTAGKNYLRMYEKALSAA